MSELPITLHSGETIVYEKDGIRVSWNRRTQMRMWQEDFGLASWISYDQMTSYNILGFEDAERLAKWWVELDKEEEQKDAE